MRRDRVLGSHHAEADKYEYHEFKRVLAIAQGTEVKVILENSFVDGRFKGRFVRGDGGLFCCYHTGVFNATVAKVAKVRTTYSGDSFEGYAGVNIVELTGRFHSMNMYLVGLRHNFRDFLDTTHSSSSLINRATCHGP